MLKEIRKVTIECYEKEVFYKTLLEHGEFLMLMGMVFQSLGPAIEKGLSLRGIWNLKEW